jgi:hypothetical protein
MSSAGPRQTARALSSFQRFFVASGRRDLSAGATMVDEDMVMERPIAFLALIPQSGRRRRGRPMPRAIGRPGDGGQLRRGLRADLVAVDRRSGGRRHRPRTSAADMVGGEAVHDNRPAVPGACGRRAPTGPRPIAIMVHPVAPDGAPVSRPRRSLRPRSRALRGPPARGTGVA